MAEGRKAVKLGKSTFIYEGGRLIGVAEGDRTGDPMILDPNIPFKTNDSAGVYSTEPGDFFKSALKRGAVNTVSSLPFFGGGRGAFALGAKLLGSLVGGAAMDKVLNPEKPGEQVMGEATLRTGISGAASGLQTHDINWRPQVSLGTGLRRFMAWFNPSIHFPYKQTIEQVPLPPQVPRNVVLTLPEPVPQVPGLPPQVQAQWLHPPGATQYGPGQMTPRNITFPVARDVNIPGWRKAGAGVVANTAIDLAPIIAELFESKPEKKD